METGPDLRPIFTFRLAITELRGPSRDTINPQIRASHKLLRAKRLQLAFPRGRRYPTCSLTAIPPVSPRRMM